MEQQNDKDIQLRNLKIPAEIRTLTFLAQGRYFIGGGGKITVLKNPNKDNPGLKERQPEKAHCLQ